MGIILELYCVQKRKHPVTFRLSHVKASRHSQVAVGFPRDFVVREDQKRTTAVSQAFQTRACELVLTVTDVSLSLLSTLYDTLGPTIALVSRFIPTAYPG